MLNCNWGFMSGAGHGWFMGGFGSIFNLLLLLLLGYLAYKLIQRVSASPKRNQDRKDSLEILKRKYVNGEISEEEFQKIRNILDS